MFKKKFLILVVSLITILSSISFASEVSISKSEFFINGTEISENQIPGITLSNKMDDGSTLNDDDIEIGNIITITEPGEYKFSGTLSDAQIAVDANKINGEVKIVLDNANIECLNAPAIFIYSKDINNENCKVTISTTAGSENTVKGGRIKTSVMDLEDQDSIFYYVEKNYDDDGTYYERYKYDGAISSDISITFDGDGILNVITDEKEGIESKMHITFNGGTCIIKSVDDSINAAADGKSIITVNDGLIIAYLTEAAEEGDGIDSNGSIYINGGTVYAFSCPNADSGLDSDLGIYVNGGEIVSIGGMNENIQADADTKVVQVTLNGTKDSTLCIADDENNVVFAMKLDRDIKTFSYTSEELDTNKNYSVYTGGTIVGNLNKWNIYENISSSDLTNANKNEYSNQMGRPGGFMQDFNQNFNQMPVNESNKTLPIVLIIVSTVLLIIAILVNLKSKSNKTSSKLLNLVLGIIIGALLALGICLINYSSSVIYMPNNFKNQINFEERNERNPMNFEQMAPTKGNIQK